jgi:hypothetical protein
MCVRSMRVECGGEHDVAESKFVMTNSLMSRWDAMANMVECRLMLSRLNSNVNDHIYDYGLRQILNDAMADKTDDDGNQLPTDQIVAKAQKRLDALYAGDLRVRRAGDAEPADPVEAEIARSVKAIMHNVYTEIGAYKSVPKGTKNRLLWVANDRRVQKNLEPFETLQEVIDEYMSKSPKAAAIRKEAERTVKMRADAGDELI